MHSRSIQPEQVIAALGVIGGFAAVFRDYIAADTLLPALPTAFTAITLPGWTSPALATGT
jgi:hypothetical protein